MISVRIVSFRFRLFPIIHRLQQALFAILLTWLAESGRKTDGGNYGSQAETETEKPPPNNELKTGRINEINMSQSAEFCVFVSALEHELTPHLDVIYRHQIRKRLTNRVIYLHVSRGMYCKGNAITVVRLFSVRSVSVRDLADVLYERAVTASGFTSGA